MNRTSLALGLVLFLSASQSFAGAGIFERQKQISAVQEYQDNFTLVRDRFFLGSNGLTSMVAPWTEDSKQWLNKWNEIWKNVQALPNARDFALARKAIEDDISEQNRQLTRLKDRVTEFGLRSDAVKDILRAKAEPIYNNELFDARVKELIANNRKLVAQIDEIRSTMVKKSARLDAVAQSATQKLDAFVTAQSVMPSSPLKEKFAELKGALALSRVVDPYVERLYDIREKVGLDLYEGRIFHAERRLADSQKTLELAINDLKLVTGVPAAFKSERQKYLTDIRNETYTNFKDLSGDPSRRYQKILEFANSSRNIARALCSEGDRSINCSLAEWLNRIPDAAVKNFSTNKLKALEFAWQAVQSGSSAESLADLKSLQEGNQP